jgi:hypothetical protein
MALQQGVCQITIKLSRLHHLPPMENEASAIQKEQGQAQPRFPDFLTGELE